MMRAKAASVKINTIFQSCRMDLETVTQLPAVEDYYFATNHGIETEAEVVKKKIKRLFEGFIERSPYYNQIQLLDKNNGKVLCVQADGQKVPPAAAGTVDFPNEPVWRNEKEFFISEVTFSAFQKGYVIYLAKPIINKGNRVAGKAVINIDYDKVTELVKAIRVGEQGYAFLVDDLGRTIAHPQFKPYEYDLSKYPYPRLREFVVDMMAGETGWKAYYYMGDKAAAYAPIPATSWSVAVTIPIEEFKKEAKAIRTKVVQVVIFVALLSAIAVIVLSYQILKPVKRLVEATERVADGDLSQEIPIKSRDEFGNLIRSFNHMIRRLKEIQNELILSEKLISMGRLSAAVAHEIKNPLNAMKGAIVYLKRRKSDDPLICEYTQLILEEIERLNRFATEFLQFARQSSPKLLTTNVNELIQSALALFEVKFREKKIRLMENYDDALPALRIDSHQMEQVLINLILNALDAMPNGGDLVISTALIKFGEGMASSMKAQIRVKDGGIGIPPVHLANVFDPFFSTKEDGTGLGLPISLNIIENHGGSLQILSREGLETRVIVELPITDNSGVREGESDKENSDRG